MNKEIKEKWIKALRSGKYKQGTGVLGSRDSLSHRAYYCCLGVLCEVARKEKIVVRKSEHGEYEYGEGKEGERLPEEVTSWAGIDNGGHLPNPVQYYVLAGEKAYPASYDEQAELIKKGWKSRIAPSLIECNDDAKMNFNQIADIIEEQL